MRRTRIPLIFVTVAGLLLGAVDMVAAAPVDIRNDRSDNTLYFTYNENKGRIPTAFSSRLIRREDRVDFFAYVVERKGAVEGRRLKARLVLRLNRKRAVRYAGRFRFWVLDEQGATAFRRTKHVDLVLRQRPGRRKQVLRWIFDLDDSGNYTAFARFRTKT